MDGEVEKLTDLGTPKDFFESGFSLWPSKYYITYSHALLYNRAPPIGFRLLPVHAILSISLRTILRSVEAPDESEEFSMTALPIEPQHIGGCDLASDISTPVQCALPIAKCHHVRARIMSTKSISNQGRKFCAD